MMAGFTGVVMKIMTCAIISKTPKKSNRQVIDNVNISSGGERGGSVTLASSAPNASRVEWV